MAEVKIFEKEEFGKIRTAGTCEEPLFCLADVCKAIELTNPSSVKARLDAEDTQLIDLHALNEEMVGNSTATFITESAFYDVILFSNSPKVKPFKKWVTKEVLPTIRKTGTYGLPKTFAEALRLAADQQEKIEQQKKQLAEQAPKVDFFDSVAESKHAIEMKAVANSLNFVKVGRNKLFQILRDNKILQQNNLPYQRYMDCNYFRTIEQKYTTQDGEVRISIKTLVYQKGVDYIKGLLRKLGYKQVEQTVYAVSKS